MQYWYISIDEDKVNINETTYYGTPKDNKRYLSQNFFKTKETAYEYAQKITNIFKENTKSVDKCFQMTYMETNKRLCKNRWAILNFGAFAKISANNALTNGIPLNIHQALNFICHDGLTLPTKEDYQKLIDDCNIYRTDYGLTFINKQDSNCEIFFPFSAKDTTTRYLTNTEYDNNTMCFFTCLNSQNSNQYTMFEELPDTETGLIRFIDRKL